MSQLTLNLPETLHQQLINLAASEGVSLNQYIIYSLTRQVSIGYSINSVTKEEINTQKESFSALLQELGQEAQQHEIDSILAERDTIQPEPELTNDIIARLQNKIKKATKKSQKYPGD